MDLLSVIFEYSIPGMDVLVNMVDAIYKAKALAVLYSPQTDLKAKYLDSKSNEDNRC